MADFQPRTQDANELINYQLAQIKLSIEKLEKKIDTSDDRYVLRREYNELKVDVAGKINKEDLRNLRNLGWTLLGSTLLAIIFTILNFVSQGRIKP